MGAESYGRKTLADNGNWHSHALKEGRTSERRVVRKVGVTELGRLGLLSSIGGYLYHTTPFLIKNLLKMCYKINCLKSLKVATSLNFPAQHRTASRLQFQLISHIIPYD